MPPTTIIDTALSPNGTYFALEEGVIWRTPDLSITGSAATWTQVMLPLEGAVFHRIVAPAENIVYVVATLANADADNNDAQMYVSINDGLVWQIYDITTGIGADDPYTVDYRETNVVGSPAGDDVYLTHQDLGEDYMPMALLFMWGNGAADVWTHYIANSEADVINNFGSSHFRGPDYIPVALVNDTLDVAAQAVVAGWLDDIFGAGGWEKDINNWWAAFRDGAGINKVKFHYEHAANPGTIHYDSYVIWNKLSHPKVTALAAAPSNAAWVYVGFEDRIMISTDGAQTWRALTTTEGANDIAVDPFNNKTITFWTPDGNLKQMMDTVMEPTILTETPLQQGRRIAYDKVFPNRLWVLANGALGCELQMYADEAWTVKQTAILGGAGLAVYPGVGGYAKVMYLSETDIYYSADDGTTVAAKKGAWSTFSAPVSIDLLEA